MLDSDRDQPFPLPAEAASLLVRAVEGAGRFLPDKPDDLAAWPVDDQVVGLAVPGVVIAEDVVARAKKENAGHTP